MRPEDGTGSGFARVVELLQAMRQLERSYWVDYARPAGGMAVLVGSRLYAELLRGGELGTIMWRMGLDGELETPTIRTPAWVSVMLRVPEWDYRLVVGLHADGSVQ